MSQIPTPQQVKGIFSEVYVLYTKWIAVKEPDWDKLLAESREIEQKYPFDICRKMLSEVINVIENSYMERGNDNG